MFERIETLIKEIENANEEIRISLNMANVSFLEYISYKRGESSAPDISAWNVQTIDQEVEKLRESIRALEKLRKETLTW